MEYFACFNGHDLNYYALQNYQIYLGKTFGTDLFEWKQVSYLLVVDYNLRFIEIVKLSSTTSRGVINHLKSTFARHGIPQIVVSDNR